LWWRRTWRTATTDEELGAAAAVDPEAATIYAPGVVANAGRAADLAGKANVTTSADVAPVSATVVGGAGDPLWAVAWLGGCGRRSGACGSEENG
jgi:hypothetical protein